MLMQANIFAGFDPATVSAIRASQAQDRVAAGRARATKAQSRHQFRRAKAEATLKDILPATFTAGDSWHVISHGDIDALSYLAHAIQGVSHFDYVALSTWCIAKPDIDQIAAWLDAGRIDTFELYAGEIFPNQYGDEFEAMQQLCQTYGCKLVIAKNHSKITLASCEAFGTYLAMESSANVNTNPRIEQTAIHANKDLFEFYREFFTGLRSIDRASANRHKV
jgi:hypothetical protein